VKDTDLLRELASTGKEFFTLPDLEKVTTLPRKSLKVSLTRWLKRGVLERATPGIYVVPGSAPKPEVIAGQLYFPCYLSFETALNRSGILNLIPYSFTFATARRTRTTTVLGREVVFRQIKKELFFGFEMCENIYVAEPEKALLDLVYMSTFGKASLQVEEMDFRSISLAKSLDYAQRYPPRVKKRLMTLPMPNK
jgi:predicted transcriptional regulator of viral defense system